MKIGLENNRIINEKNSWAWNSLLIIVSSAGICILTLLLGIGMFDVQLFLDTFRRPLIFLLNWMPILLLQVFFYAILGRQWLAFLLNSLIFVTASVGDFFKLKFRSEPFVFSDVSMVRAAIEVSGTYDLTPNTRILLSVLMVLGGTVFLYLSDKLLRKKHLGWSTRIICVLTVLFSSVCLWKTVYTNDSLYSSQKTSPVRAVLLWEQQRQAAKGFVYQFLYSIHDSAQREPAGYSSEAAVRALSSFSEYDVPESKKVNILVLQLEAFCDLTGLGITGIDPDAYRAFHQLQNESISGTLVVNVFAGGTVDTERCFLTGSYNLFEYRHNTPSTVSWFNDQGYITVGSHPNVSFFYNRENVNRYLGFSDYWYMNNHYAKLLPEGDNGWFSNPVLFSEFQKQFIELIESGEHVFSFNVTLQGHGPYDIDCDRFTTKLWHGESTESASRCLNNYLNSVMETGELLWALVSELQDLDEPVVLVLYGDHKPGLGNGSSIYEELGINLNSDTEIGFLNRYSTPYLIWANNTTKQLIGNDFQGQGPTISSGYLMNLLFNQLGWAGSPFLQFTNSVMERIPVISSNDYYYENETFVKELSSEGQLLMDKYEFVQYYLRHQ